MNKTPVLKIGTRGSPLALAQAYEVRDRLCEAHGMTSDDIEIIVFQTTGDRIQDRALGEIGGKGLFTLEIEEALTAGGIDLAVHSMKDMPTQLPKGLEISALLPREDVRDALISRNHSNINDLPQGALIGTASLRRQAQILNIRPDLKVITFRGNVQTRLRKINAGEVAATFLAYAGLRRLDNAHEATQIIPTDVMLPAVAQGAIGIETRIDDVKVTPMVTALNDADTALQLSTERAFLGALDGSCRTPLAGLATINGDELSFKCEILRPDGTVRHATSRIGGHADARDMGLDAAKELRGLGGENFFTT